MTEHYRLLAEAVRVHHNRLTREQEQFLMECWKDTNPVFEYQRISYHSWLAGVKYACAIAHPCIHGEQAE